MVGQVIYLDWIERSRVQAEPEARFVFGDNALRVGLGGQAASMRGEPNAIGVATKFAPGMGEGDFFSDGDALAVLNVVGDLQKVTDALAEGHTIYVPRDGLGTGLSELPQRAPAIANLITAFFHTLPGERCAWEFV